MRKNPASWETLMRRARFADNGCWEWTGYKSADGYGRVRVGGRMVSVHRLAWELTFGHIGRRVVMHGCDNPACFNPMHLSPGTPGANNADRRRKGRCARGSRHHLSRLTAEDVRAIRADPDPRPVQIAARYGVHPNTVRAVLKRDTWAFLEARR